MSLNKYYKEVDYVKEMSNKRKLGVGFKRDLKILAKYYRHLHPEYDMEQIEKLLYDFCNKKCKDWFNKVLHYNIVDNALKYAFDDDNKLIQIDSLSLTDKEMEFIDKLNSVKFSHLDKKIIFALLVINKLNNKKNQLKGFSNKNNYFGGSGEYSYKSLLDTLSEKLTRTFKEKGIHETIKRFNDEGLTRTTHKLSLELLFLNEIEDSDMDVLEITDFDTIGLFYEYWIGSNKIKFCEECNKNLTKITNFKNKYCKKCSKEIEKKMTNERVKRFKRKVNG